MASIHAGFRGFAGPTTELLPISMLLGMSDRMTTQSRHAPWAWFDWAERACMPRPVAAALVNGWRRVFGLSPEIRSEILQFRVFKSQFASNKETLRMHKKFNRQQFWGTPLGVSFCGYFVLMGLVGALPPPDILSAYSWTKPFTNFMASLVSQIDKVTALGIDADINRFYFAVMRARNHFIN